MEQKRKRIEAFIETLPQESKSGGYQSTLLPTNLDGMGGASDNGGNCSNYTQKSCNKSKNGGDCKNYAQCDDARNSGTCVNNPPVVGKEPGDTVVIIP